MADRKLNEFFFTKHKNGQQTETFGTVMIPGTWVFGYEINEVVRFISVIK